MKRKHIPKIHIEEYLGAGTVNSWKFGWEKSKPEGPKGPKGWPKGRELKRIPGLPVFLQFSRIDSYKLTAISFIKHSLKSNIH
ncbi:hypothetical protein MSMTP_1040 [Methanosarcina sp. MTP4]|nr:hypothetical protein MSMTP_1040 [Methanosarcina sp. MTP4]